MVIFYNKEKELYYKVDVSLIDPHNELEDYDMAPNLVKDLIMDDERQAYIINNDLWEKFKEILDDFVSQSGSIRSHDDIKHYAIYVAEPFYKVYNSCNEWINEDTYDNLSDVQMCFLNTEQYTTEKYTVVPYFAEECDFYPRIERWSGDY